MSYRRLLQAVVGLCLANAFAAGPAAATGLVLSLGDVIGSEDSFSAEGSPLRFSDFELTSEGDDIDLDLFRIHFDELGFRITGPFHVHKGDVIDLTLDYVVESDQFFITDAKLGIIGFALGKGASASVLETFEEFPDVTLETSIDHGLRRVRDHERLGIGETTLHVSKNILLESVLFPNGHGHGPFDDDDDRHGHGDDYDDDDDWHGLGHGGDWDRHGRDDDDCDCGHCRRSKLRKLKLSVAHLAVIEQRFKVEPIPEPGSALLVGVGLAGLALLRSRAY